MIRTFHFPIKKPDINKEWNRFVNRIKSYSHFLFNRVTTQSPIIFINSFHKKVTRSIFQENQMQSFP